MGCLQQQILVSTIHIYIYKGNFADLLYDRADETPNDERKELCYANCAWPNEIEM